jgi:hypothetical protein
LDTLNLSPFQFFLQLHEIYGLNATGEKEIVEAGIVKFKFPLSVEIDDIAEEHSS